MFNREEYIKLKLDSLRKSKFRSSFKLREKEFNYIREKGMDKIKEHAYDFIEQRIAKAVILNDGKQTPMKGHPVFISQHATATCCRGCLYKWHNIKKSKELNQKEIDYIVDINMEWIKEECKKNFQ